MNYVILDNNRFYAEGLRYALLRRNAPTQVKCGTVKWRRSLLACDTLVVRCRFSVTRTHLALVDILLQLEARCWEGTVYLVCNEKGWALATHLRKRFSTLNCCLTGMEFNVLDRLVNGQSVKHVAHMTQISEKQVSTYKCNALKKLNANNLLQLLL
ncbi:LuxR C-terminal-related transcriptional regulator [Citrobacter cronae]|uniref:LuxR C-terminal-related transcriptional regulator n=1 Tax=Citrobacter cronae TaxID=1748967 RepID=UPI003AA80DBE